MYHDTKGGPSLYSVIEHVARICSLSDWKSVSMVMLTAGFDCSQDKERKYFIMAGFLSSAEVWKEFDKHWRERLRQDNLPYFHMWAFAAATTHPRKPFDKTWLGAEKRRQKLLSDLLDLIALHSWRKFGCILPTDSLAGFSVETREQSIPALIALAGRLIWGELEAWRRREKFQQPARLVFEHGDTDRGALIKAMEEITGRTPSFEHKKDYPEKGIVAFTPLQASDILAYEIQKVTCEEGRLLNEFSFRFPYEQLEKIPGNIRMLQPGGIKLIDEWWHVQKYFKANPLNSGTVQ